MKHILVFGVEVVLQINSRKCTKTSVASHGALETLLLLPADLLTLISSVSLDSKQLSSVTFSLVLFSRGLLKDQQ